MKTIFTTLILLLSLSASSQTKVWESLKMDSIEFVQAFGSVHEYEWQKQTAYESSHKHRVFFIGFAPAWLTYLTDYAVYEMKYSPEVSYGDGSNWISLETTPGISNGKPIPFVAKALLDAKGRIKSVTITGEPNDIIRLFVYYWDSKFKLEELKKGSTIYQNFLHDKIALSWNNTNPMITITANPAVGFTD